MVFDLIVEKKIFLHGLETLEQAVSSLLHVCFVANLQYPNGSGLLCTFIQRWIAKLDEYGTTAKRSRKDQSAKEDKSTRSYEKVFSDYATKVLQLCTVAEK